MHGLQRSPGARSGARWVACALVLLLAGCAPTAPTPGASGSPGEAEPAQAPTAEEPAGPESATPSGPAALTASSTAAEVRERVGSTGGVVLGYLDDALGEVTVQDAPTHRAIGLVPGPRAAGETVLALIAAPEGGTVEVLGDGSAVARMGGVVVGAVTAPVVVGGDPADDGAGDDATASPAPRPVARLVLRGDVLQVVLVGRGTDGAGARVELTVAADAVASLTWGDREGGRSLAVEPTDWARWAGEAGTELLWSELVAEEPEADSATMRDQLVCHQIGAPDKATWNLEPWRPDVGLLGTLAAACNPT